MTAPQTPPTPAKIVRLLHAAMVTGMVLFTLVAHFLVLPTKTAADTFPPNFVRGALGVALALCALSFVLRQRVPRRSVDETADLFWMTARTPVMITWAALEGACILAIVTYMLSGAREAIGVVAIILIAFAAMNPAYLERR
jgi:hypothetical protein